jgi:hypothetical protein
MFLVLFAKTGVRFGSRGQQIAANCGVGQGARITQRCLRDIQTKRLIVNWKLDD